MDVQSSTFKNWQVIKVSGQIDSKTVIKLRDFIDSELKPDQPVALELTDVPFMSSAGLRTLLTLQRKTKELNISLALIGLGDGIADTMKVTGFYQFFTIYESLEAIPGV
ncbi:anti-anti-sigma factor family protein [Synechococcus sp. A18-25c]|uniref:STAS domain-containing protein n=1 Tax=unclassified Synechococcus TaxID=2626047 RepID=UPI0016477148|nr:MULTISPECIES: STAS domain-containing protein [unclassified Synechococcus]QNI49618.1 anti-anti-sigma factor family protein [Synechococcus sp. A15-60]QNJ21228.1 anti-anti-sigma factor family protein [Synechococcus sp. A18-25c]